MNLTNTDYKSILLFYDIPYRNLKAKQIKELAENILANKLCRCIKKVTPSTNGEGAAISICNNSILKKKGIISSRFKCKKKPRFLPFKKTRTKLKKINRSLTIKRYNTKLKKANK